VYCSTSRNAKTILEENMHRSFALMLFLILITSSIVSLLPVEAEYNGNYNHTYRSEVRFGGISEELHVSVPSSLYDYYNGKTIKISVETDYSKLVTPDAVKPLAENLRNLTHSDEAFANAVLTVVHQIPYKDDCVKYPVESLADNSGKCDTLSLLAASIMKAGGLDVVLLCFKEVRHINVGVHLNNEPHTTWWWSKPTGYEFDGKIYWMAECTSAMNWKVGEAPPLLVEEKALIVPLENSEKSSPARISSRLSNTVQSSSITINLSSDSSDHSCQEKTLIISGLISPAYANATVTLYFSKDGISYNSMKTETDNWGLYSFVWSFNSTGTHYIRTNWSGNAECAGADSEMLTVFVGFPQSPNQFEGLGYYCTDSRGDAITHELLALQGVEDFLDVHFSGTGVLLTGEKTTTVLANIPDDLQIVSMPEDIAQKTNDQFSFVLRKSGEGNCSFSVRGLDNYNVVELNKLERNGRAKIDASDHVTENTWYKIKARISEDEITAELYDANGTLLESIVNKDGAANANELVILLVNNKDRAVAFKNLNIEILNQPMQPDEMVQEIASAIGLLAFTFLLITLFVAVIHKKRVPVIFISRNVG
jgi:hypothetical protein